MELIRAEHLQKTFKNGKVETHVIKDISLSIEEGEFVTITGPSGSGKSTLLYLLSGLEEPTEGSIYFKGKNINDLKDNEIAKIRQEELGFIYQFFNLISEMNVADNVYLPSLVGSKPLDSNRLKESLQQVGLEAKTENFPHELSGGQQQRVAIARVLYAQPNIIFADEPTGNLDSENSKVIMDLFQQMNREYNITIVMVTHSNEFAKMGTREIQILDGKIC